MSNETQRPAQCVLGHGECPQHCQLHERSQQATDDLGDLFDPYQSRIAAVFGLDVLTLVNILAACEKEPLPDPDDDEW